MWDVECSSDMVEWERVFAPRPVATATDDWGLTQLCSLPEELVRRIERPAWMGPLLMPAFVLLVIAEPADGGATWALTPDRSLNGSICCMPDVPACFADAATAVDAVPLVAPSLSLNGNCCCAPA